MQSLAFLSSQKQFAATGLMVFGALLSYYFFPFDEKLNDTVQALVSGAVFFLALPVLFVKLILKEPISSLGFRGSERRFGWISLPIVTISALCILYLSVRYYSVEEAYYIPLLAKGSFPIFLLYEVLFVGAIAFLYEVFFRGFVQLLWLRKFGLSAAFLQAAVSIGAVFFLAGMTWQEFPMMLAAFFAGFVALYTGSIWYSWGASWLILFLSDAYLLSLL